MAPLGGLLRLRPLGETVTAGEPSPQAVPVPPPSLWCPALLPGSQGPQGAGVPCLQLQLLHVAPEVAQQPQGPTATLSEAGAAPTDRQEVGRAADARPVSMHTRGKGQPGFGWLGRVPPPRPCRLLAAVPRACIRDKPWTRGAIAARGWGHVCFPRHRGRHAAHSTGHCWPVWPLDMSWRSPRVSETAARAAPPERSHENPLNSPPQPCWGLRSRTGSIHLDQPFLRGSWSCRLHARLLLLLPLLTLLHGDRNTGGPTHQQPTRRVRSLADIPPPALQGLPPGVDTCHGFHLLPRSERGWGLCRWSRGGQSLPGSITALPRGAACHRHRVPALGHCRVSLQGCQPRSAPAEVTDGRKAVAESPQPGAPACAAQPEEPGPASGSDTTSPSPPCLSGHAGRDPPPHPQTTFFLQPEGPWGAPAPRSSPRRCWVCSRRPRRMLSAWLGESGQELEETLRGHRGRADLPESTERLLSKRCPRVAGHSSPCHPHWASSRPAPT